MVKQTFQFSDQQWYLDHKEDLCSMTAEAIVSWAKTQCNENILLLFARKKPMGKRICTILLSTGNDADKRERIAYFLENLGFYIPIKEKYADSLGLPFFSTDIPPSITLKVSSPAAYSLYDEIFTAWEKADLGKYTNSETRTPNTASVSLLEIEDVKEYFSKTGPYWF